MQKADAKAWRQALRHAREIEGTVGRERAERLLPLDEKSIGIIFDQLQIQSRRDAGDVLAALARHDPASGVLIAGHAVHDAAAGLVRSIFERIRNQAF
jgi:hypothetical protein